MGLIRFLKSLVDPKVTGEQIVRANEKAFSKYQKMMPNADIHILLANTWLSRIAAHGKNATDSTIQGLALSKTMTYACLPAPHCARALGLYILYKEGPHIVRQYPEFSKEYDQLMAPVMRALEDGSWEELYRKYNPTDPHGIIRDKYDCTKGKKQRKY